MARARKFVVLIWDKNVPEEIDVTGKLENLGLILHEVDGIDSVLEQKFTGTLIFFYIVDKFNSDFDKLGDLKRKFSGRKFICIDIVGFESLSRICDQSNVIYIRRKFDIKNLESIIIDQCIDVLNSNLDPSHVEASNAYDVRKLAERVDAAASALRALRLNSTGEIIDELLRIGSALRGEAVPLDQRAKHSREISVKGETKNALAVIGSVFDAMENSRLASLVVSGAVTAVIGCGGWSAVACQTVCLASWHGKDALMKAIDRLPGPRARSK